MATPLHEPADRAPPAWRARGGALARRALDAMTQPQVSGAARERRDLLVLLAAIGLIVLPHRTHLPLWATGLFGLLWSWRLWLTLRRRPLPGRTVLVPLLLAIGAAVWLEYRTLIGRDAGVAFLVLLTGLKLIEMRARRDIYVVVVLGLFVLLTQFMYDQTLPIAALALVAIAGLFFVLVGTQALHGDLSARRKGRVLLALLLQALPLAAVLFLLFPRLDGPLWGNGGEQARGETGLSDTMRPGALNELIQSDKIAFRARFDGAPPAPETLYWRGPVLGDFDGQTWRARQDRMFAHAAAPHIDVDPASAIDYEVTLEPHWHSWLFAIEAAAAPSDHDNLRGAMDSDMQMLAGRRIVNRVRYRVRSYTRYAADAGVPELALQDWLDLPPGFNPETMQFAVDLQNRIVPAGAGQHHEYDARLVQAVLDHLHTGGFHYTLTPPALGRNQIDDFLFRTRLGYCEHFASAFVVLMRALDVPARVVTGYQGGELNPSDGYMTVRQSDAHAWAEVWLAGRGWVRIDPTQVVAPLRIERGAPAIARQFGLGRLGVAAPLAWAHALRLRWEAVENGWNQWVLSYSFERQRQIMKALGMAASWQSLALLFAAVLIAVLALLGLTSLRHRDQRPDPLALLFGQLRRKLAAAGLDAAPHRGPRALAGALPGRLGPVDALQARALLLDLEQARYGRPGAAGPADQRRLARRVRRFRPRPRR